MEYRSRLVDSQLADLLGTFGALMVTGPRACGKTTTASRLAADTARLDEPQVAAVFQADPDAALAARREPLLLDEWQDAPDVLAAVKRSVDQLGSTAGRFILTGSVDADVAAGKAWPGTGRLIPVRMFGMTVRERLGHVDGAPALADMLSGRVDLPVERPDLAGYVDYALQGGFPEVTKLMSESARQRWFDGYISQLVTRDASRLGAAPDPNRMRRHLEAWAFSSAGTPSDATIYNAAGIDRKTHIAYEALLLGAFVGDLVPCWNSNRLSRLAKAPKRYVVDSGLMAAVAGIGRSDVLNDGDLLGRLIDTFVASEIRTHLVAEVGHSRMFHLRTDGGRQEVDLLVEQPGGTVYGIEIKSTSAPRPTDARHLEWLAERLGDRFVGGSVLHTGREAFELTHNVKAVPICALWGRRQS